MSIFTKSFAKDTLERSLRTGAQAVLLTLFGGSIVTTLPVDNAEAINAFAWDWRVLAGSFVGGGILAVLFALVAPVRNDQ